MPDNIPTNTHDSIACAKRVIALESDALISLAETIGESFANAVNCIAQRGGRVIVSGMGKSGHIGAKITATLASTGTPSHFVHPAEASHGDMGMIGENDVVLALSNSGETAELSDIIAYTRRFNIPLIAITGRADSTLGKSADITLTLPTMTEACPNNQAPTTSTTATLALGDAIAVALLEQRGFSAEDFGVFHPGGKLGKQLVRVGDIMHPIAQTPIVSPTTTMGDALIIMAEKNFGCLAVTDDRHTLLGVITDGDLRRSMSPALPTTPAQNVMTTTPTTLSADIMAGQAVALMNDKKINVVFVTNDHNTLQGVLHIHDLLSAGIV